MKQTIIVLLCILLLPVGAILAQGDEPVELPDGSLVTLPEGWTFEDQAGVYYFTAGTDTYLAVYLPAITAATAAGAFDDPPGAEDLLIYMGREIHDYVVNITRMEDREDGVQFTYADMSGSVLLAVLDRADGLLYFEVHAPFVAFKEAIADAEAIVAQIELSESGGPCYVSTDAQYGVPMRVGPGTNRGEFTTLMPADGEVLVIGKATVSGDVWWRVEEDEPAAAELWVADADVNTSGACGTVGLVSAPPLIPAIPQAPPADSGDAPADGGDSPAPVDSSLVPRMGSWNMTLSNEMLASCEGGDTIRAPIDLGYGSGVVRLSLSNGNRTLVLSGAGAGTLAFAQAGPGLYVANESFPDAYGVFYLHINGPTSMWGEMVVGFLDIPCSGTLPVSFSFIG